VESDCLDSKVTVAEFLDNIGGVGTDEKISYIHFILQLKKQFQKLLTRQGLKFKLSTGMTQGPSLQSNMEDFRR
jgi:hypothetical protein